MAEYVVEIREKGEVTIPKQLRKRYALAPKKQVKLIPKVEGILIKPKPDDPIAELKGLARNVWPSGKTSVDIVRELRKRADLESKARL